MILACAIALCAGVIDWRERRLPNSLCIALACVGLAFQLARVATPGMVAALPWERALDRALPAPGVCVACAAALVAVLGGIEMGLRGLRGEQGMGFGDVKYLGAWACVLGPLTIAAFAAACLAGAVCALSMRERDFALGPWIGLACCAVLAIVPFV